MEIEKNQSGQSSSQEVDARVLGRILAAQNIDFVLPDITHVVEFFSETLRTIPGIKSCHPCLPDFGVSDEAPRDSFCENCQTKRSRFARQDGEPALQQDFTCELSRQSGWVSVPIASLTHLFGYFAFEIDDFGLFQKYKPFISNLANYVALSLENREQRKLLQRSHAEKEREIEERTRDLVVANKRLRVEIEVKHRAEDALRREQTLLNRIMETSPVGITLVDPQGKIIFANSHAQQVLGLTKDEITQRKFNSPDWKITTYNGEPILDGDLPFNKVISTGQPVIDDQHTISRHNGQKIHLSINGAPVVNDAGDLESVVFTIENITERKETETRLRASEQLFRALVENSPDYIARYDKNFRRIYVNPAIQSIFQKSQNPIIGTTPAVQSPLYAPQSYIEHMQKTIETLTENVFETPFRTAQGDMHWGQIRFVPELDLDGKVSTVLAIGRDVHSIKENELRFRMLAENFPDFIIRFDHDGRIQYSNPAFSTAHGLPAENIIGKTIDELPFPISPAQNNDLLAFVRRTFEEGVANETEARWHTAKGERIYEVRYVPEKDAGGNVISVLSIMRDVFERRQAEEEIRKLNQELERRVAERTSQLESANKELEAFAYSVSHDLRAPLRHIDGFMQLLVGRTGTSLDPKSLHYMKNISDAARRMGMLIDDLLSFSRMGRDEMRTACVDLNEVLQEVLHHLSPEIEGRNIAWKIATLPNAFGDRAMIRIVFSNLVSNALKFTGPCNAPSIEIGSQEADPSELQIYVRDNGVGFDMKYADKLFGVFQRLHRVDEFEGTGIGLANVRRIIQRHGGKTWAEGQLGYGATFYFTLPKAQDCK
jgi:PAS domain S-box-containing protein